MLALPSRHDSAAENCNTPFTGVTIKLEGDIEIAPCSFATDFGPKNSAQLTKTRIGKPYFAEASCESTKYGEIISVGIATVPSIHGAISSLETISWMSDLKRKISWASCKALFLYGKNGLCIPAETPCFVQMCLFSGIGAHTWFTQSKLWVSNWGSFDG